MGSVAWRWRRDQIGLGLFQPDVRSSPIAFQMFLRVTERVQPLRLRTASRDIGAFGQRTRPHCAPPGSDGRVVRRRLGRETLQRGRLDPQRDAVMTRIGPAGQAAFVDPNAVDRGDPIAHGGADHLVALRLQRLDHIAGDPVRDVDGVRCGGETGGGASCRVGANPPLS